MADPNDSKSDRIMGTVLKRSSSTSTPLRQLSAALDYHTITTMPQLRRNFSAPNHSRSLPCSPSSRACSKLVKSSPANKLTRDPRPWLTAVMVALTFFSAAFSELPGGTITTPLWFLLVIWWMALGVSWMPLKAGDGNRLGFGQGAANPNGLAREHAGSPQAGEFKRPSPVVESVAPAV